MPDCILSEVNIVRQYNDLINFAKKQKIFLYPFNPEYGEEIMMIQNNNGHYMVVEEGELIRENGKLMLVSSNSSRYVWAIDEKFAIDNWNEYIYGYIQEAKTNLKDKLVLTAENNMGKIMSTGFVSLFASSFFESSLVIAPWLIFTGAVIKRNYKNEGSNMTSEEVNIWKNIDRHSYSLANEKFIDSAVEVRKQYLERAINRKNNNLLKYDRDETPSIFQFIKDEKNTFLEVFKEDSYGNRTVPVLNIINNKIDKIEENHTENIDSENIKMIESKSASNIEKINSKTNEIKEIFSNHLLSIENVFSKLKDYHKQNLESEENLEIEKKLDIIIKNAKKIEKLLENNQKKEDEVVRFTLIYHSKLAHLINEYLQILSNSSQLTLTEEIFKEKVNQSRRKFNIFLDNYIKIYDLQKNKMMEDLYLEFNDELDILKIHMDALEMDLPKTSNMLNQMLENANINSSEKNIHLTH